MVFSRKKIFKIFIEVHNYNDMAKTWMQNFIYILMIKSQSGAHKTINQILPEFLNFDLISWHFWRHLATLFCSLHTASKAITSYKKGKTASKSANKSRQYSP